MSFADALARKNASVFRVLGEAATWLPASGAPIPNIMIKRMSPDEVVRFGLSNALMASIIIRVQKSDVPAPAEGDQVQAGVDLLSIVAEPTFVDPHRLVWECQAAIAS